MSNYEDDQNYKGVNPGNDFYRRTVKSSYAKKNIDGEGQIKDQMNPALVRHKYFNKYLKSDQVIQHGKQQDKRIKKQSENKMISEIHFSSVEPYC